MNSYGVFFDWQRATPTYHAFDNDRLNERDEEASRDYTKCGRLVAEFIYGTSRYNEPGDWIPIKHARKIGKPCRLCFPNGDANSQPQASGSRVQNSHSVSE